jgi:hypothetical protein
MKGVRTNEHLTADEIARWWSATSPAHEIVGVAEHADLCAQCRDALAANHPPEAVATALRQLLMAPTGDDEHLSADDLCRWVDGRIDEADQAFVERHLERCAQCSAEADDLADFAALPRSGSSRRSWRGWSAAAALAIMVLGGWLVIRHDTPPPPAAAGSAARAQHDDPGVVLRDGALILRANGTVHGVPGEWGALAQQFVRSPRLTPPAVALALVPLRERQRSESSTPPAIELKDPVSKVVLTDRPTFRWTATVTPPFRVDIYDDHFHRVASSGAVSATSWTPATTLQRGLTLNWTVTPVGAPNLTSPAPPQPPAVFSITPIEQADEIERARATGSHLLTGIVLWRAGLLEDAAFEFARLARENPESIVARELAESSRREARFEDR